MNKSYELSYIYSYKENTCIFVYHQCDTERFVVAFFSLKVIKPKMAIEEFHTTYERSCKNCRKIRYIEKLICMFFIFIVGRNDANKRKSKLMNQSKSHNIKYCVLI